MAHALQGTRNRLGGLRVKVTATLIAFALLPLAAGALMSQQLAERAMRADVAAKLDRATEADLASVVRHVEDALDTLERTAGDASVRNALAEADSDALAETLSGIGRRDAVFSAHAVLDAAGGLIAFEGLSSERARAVAAGAFGPPSDAARVATARAGSEPETLVLSQPIRAGDGSGTVIGAVHGVLDRTTFLDRLAAIRVWGSAQNGDHVLVLCDARGTILYRTAGDGAGAVVDDLLGPGGEGGASSRRYLQSFSRVEAGRLPGLGELVLHAAVSERVALAHLVRLQRGLLATSALVALALVFGTIVTITRMVLVPGNRLRRAIAAAQEGVPIPDALTRRHDEIGILSRTFARVMQQLSQARTALVARSEAEIARHASHLDAALNNMMQGLCLFDDEDRLIVSNRQFAEIFGLDAAALAPGTRLETILAAMRDAGACEGRDIAEVAGELRAAVASGAGAVFSMTLPDGRTISVSQVPMPAGWVVTYSDITERRRAEARMAHMAHHDALTGLSNRVKFRERLEAALDAKTPDTFAVFCLDLDHFKPVNDTLGHPIGDKLLQAVAGRLKRCVREGDVVARLGGDEFAILQFDMTDAESPTHLAKRIIETLCAPYRIDDHQIVIGTSVGIGLSPADGTKADTLIKAADLALYRAKIDGRGAFRFFEAEMDARMQARRALELDLRAALSRDEFRLCYQPIVDMGTDRVSCFEALLRWHHPERGLVRPDQFIPLAEETGLINRIGAWVLHRACLEAASWPAGIRVAVNLSPLQFKGMDVVREVESALADSGLDAGRLELEITETVLLTQTDATLALLEKLRALGVRISMDDFGTGYSSLSYLRKFPFDKIKIDRSFTRDLHESSEAQAIVRAITSLGLSLGMAVTVEGVETADQLEAVRAEGCTEVQGYVYSPPVPAEELHALLSRLHRHVLATLPRGA
ncbi:EAL domain-containing protein [uncultured Jannaschia sp.]|uniref:bifunctional diguanylate cyclase/phosphodiesterase n=1 Tax=uncultured Jannaschia sp. TaxID=293347 RepID=UPI002616D491|nr:EAL domain-containing protein [uncultured Jannaschia sp.]